MLLVSQKLFEYEKFADKDFGQILGKQLFFFLVYLIINIITRFLLKKQGILISSKNLGKVFARLSNQTMGNSKLVFLDRTSLSFRVHCFNNNFGNQQCPNLEISYLLQCHKLPDSLKVHNKYERSKYEKANIKCKTLPHVTYPLPETTTLAVSTGKMPSFMFLHLLTTVLAF